MVSYENKMFIIHVYFVFRPHSKDGRIFAESRLANFDSSISFADVLETNSFVDASEFLYVLM